MGNTADSSTETQQLLHYDDFELQKEHLSLESVLAVDDDVSQCSVSQCSSAGSSPCVSRFESKLSPRSKRLYFDENRHHAHAGQLAKIRRSGQLLFGVSGVYVAYLYYGFVQEELFRYRSADGGAFRYAWFLQVMESAASIVLGVTGRCICGGGRMRDLPYQGIMLSGVSQVFSKVFCSLSLAAGLSYPVMTLAKSAKIVPVMLGQLFLGGSTYGLRDCVFAGLLVTGTVMLSLGSSNNKASGSSNSAIGILFVLVSLAMDGCTGGLQKQLKRNSGSKPGTFDFILFTHLTMLSTALVVSLVTGDLLKGLFYVRQETEVALLVTELSAVSVVGQCFIFFLIAQFDPAVCATVTTTRKMWSVLLSIVLFHHQLSATGYSGLAVALVGLLVEVHNKVLGGNHASHHQPRQHGRTASTVTKDLDSVDSDSV